MSIRIISSLLKSSQISNKIILSRQLSILSSLPPYEVINNHNRDSLSSRLHLNECCNGHHKHAFSNSSTSTPIVDIATGEEEEKDTEESSADAPNEGARLVVSPEVSIRYMKSKGELQSNAFITWIVDIVILRLWTLIVAIVTILSLSWCLCSLQSVGIIQKEFQGSMESIISETNMFGCWRQNQDEQSLSNLQRRISSVARNEPSSFGTIHLSFYWWNRSCHYHWSLSHAIRKSIGGYQESTWLWTH